VEEDFGQRLRRLRGTRSLRGLATRTGWSKTHLADVETGRRRPTLELARTLDDALRAGGELVAALPEECGRQPGVSPTLGETLRLWDDLLRRRDFVLATATATAGLAGPTLALPVSGGSERLAAHRELHAALGRLDNLVGAPAVHDQVVAHHRAVMAWYNATPPGGERRRIADLAATTAGLVGFTHFDLGNYRAAAHAYREAADLAAEAGDISSIANHIGQMSRVASETGRHDYALTFANAALHAAGTRAHPAVRSWLHAVRSRHHAACGDHRAAHRDLDAAWALLSSADDGATPVYIAYLTEGELSKWTAHTRNHLGEGAQAVTAVADARAQWRGALVRGSAEVHVAAARAHLATGDVDQAVAGLTQAATVARATGSARNLASVTGVRAELSPYRTSPAVRDFDEFFLTGARP
jgi:transcriptional regulator with XRE-family HTH domain